MTTHILKNTNRDLIYVVAGPNESLRRTRCTSARLVFPRLVSEASVRVF
jgi:hypothetical protein